MEDDEDEGTTSASTSQPTFSTIDSMDKKDLRNKFFELNN
jgi:hypothetical protein